VVLGVRTNIPYLLDILEQPNFVQGDITTNFLDRHMTPWQEEPDLSNSTWLAVAAWESLKEERVADGPPAEGRSVEASYDPWHAAGAWRNV
ncbi:MAG TPA: hypothetical protein VE553_06240, partial [Candidatus Binatia bacterium]|nr:hypothetical protein [Candidatus Binatia bacterium]